MQQQEPQEDLICEIFTELDMIRLMSRLSISNIQNNSKDFNTESYIIIFQDIQKRCWKISELFEKFDNFNEILFKIKPISKLD